MEYVDQFFSGGVDPSIPQRVLIGLTVAGGFAVGIGIIWDAARSGHLWTLPTAFVFFGVVVEAAATVILFEFDEGISHAQQATIGEQQSKIIALETRLAQRVIPPDKAKIMVESLRKFTGTPFDFSLNPSPEPETFADRIRAILKEAGWKPVPYPAGGVALGAGDDRARVFISSLELGLEISVSKDAEWREPMAALATALAKAGFNPSKVNEATDGSAPDSAIHIYVGAKQ